MNKICIYAICKNESKFVDQWFKNVMPADYIAILDTGSTDGTYEKLQEYQSKYPDKIIVKQKKYKQWRFDVARNDSMKLVPEDANILMSTDFDELLTDGWADAIRSNWKPETNRGFYKYAWSHNSAGEGTDIFVYDKIHDRNYHWIFPVHEVLWPNDGFDVNTASGIQFDSFMLHHYPDNTKSRSSYMALLQLSAAENPDNCHVMHLLAREYYNLGDLNTALEKYLAVLNMEKIDVPEYRLVLLDALLQVAQIYKAQNNYDETIWYCHEFIKEDPTYKEPYYILAEIFNEMNMPVLAEAMCLTADKYGTRKYTWVEKSCTWTSWGHDCMGVAQCKLGNYDAAIDCAREVIKHEPKNLQAYKNYSVYLEAKNKEISKKMEQLAQ